MNPYFSHLQCSSCSSTYPNNVLINLCHCGKPLFAKYTFSESRNQNILKNLDDSSNSMWRYSQVLPVNNTDEIVSLGEGLTPLIESRKIARLLGHDRVWIKDESSNPTGSFKARGLSLAVTMAKLLGAKKLAIPSAGNAGGALAAYAARAGLEANIFLPRDVPLANRVECQQLGAKVTLIDGLINDCGRLVAEKSKKEQWFDLSTLKEPYRIEGKKTLGLELAEQLGLRKADEFAPLWVVDFPLLEWDEETERYHAMHHPFTSPKPGQMELLNTDPGAVKANAYDLVLNGNEIGGGSIRIHDSATQAKMFDYLGFTPEEAKNQFGFLMDAFQYGAPPHGGLAFGLDRLVAILGGQETIRDFIAFPKNNSGRDVMIDAPSPLDKEQLEELHLKVEL